MKTTGNGQKLGCWHGMHADLLRLLRKAGERDSDLAVIDSVYVLAFGGGQATGPSPLSQGPEQAVAAERAARQRVGPGAVRL